MEYKEKEVIRPGMNGAWAVSSLLAVISGTLFLIVLTAGNEIDRLGWAESSLIRTEALADYANMAWIAGVALAIICIASVIVSVWKCGTKYDDGTVRLTKFDKIFPDVLAAAGIFLMALVMPAYMCLQGWFMLEIVNGKLLPKIALTEGAKTFSGLEKLSETYDGFIGASLSTHWVLLFFGVLLTAVLLGAELMILQSIARQIKNRTVLKNTLVWNIISRIDGFMKKTDMNTKWVMVILAVGALISATWVGLILVAALIIWKVPAFMRKYGMVKEGIHELKEGNLDHQIPLEGDGEMERLAAEVNEIAGARKRSLEKELKSQRLKTDLITNVSHDLKTPLTSMVTYVDLLKKEGLDSPNAPEYLRILDEKTNRLQKLSTDLFDAAKASSGDIPVEMGDVDILQILNQAMAELDSNLRQADLEIIVNPKTENTRVRADGRLLWRVLENVLTNAAKYALPGSRAYIDIYEERGRVFLEMKNISREPLNIDPDELMERFKRGDESRSTEGSGLGLAIATDLCRLMGGNFKIAIDGDLFKAVVELEKA
ncbi:MAG: HAMP domain-containing histidine kinase [Firmicutes bacterium]|nr:HAMP domain-containing histidine kinase [Bacillota bacterium]